MDYTNPAKRVKPIPGGDTEDEYRRVMKKIMEGLTKDNLDTILFLCKDSIPVAREFTSAMQLLNFLESRDIVSKNSAIFVAEVLHIIRRMDLLKIIPCIKNKKHFETEYLGFSYSQFSNYRVLTVKLQEELSQNDFETFKYQCAQHLNIRSIDGATNVLMLLRSLEEEDVISFDDFEELVKILECIDNVKPLKMFQRLLEGDETVAVPDGKKQQRQIQNSDAIFPDRHYIPEQISPPPAYDNTRRVEEMPYSTDPPGYQPARVTIPPRRPQSQKWYTEPNTDTKHHDSNARTMYDIGPAGLTWQQQEHGNAGLRSFEGEEVTPKHIVGTTPGSDNGTHQFFSLPSQHVEHHHHRRYSDNAHMSMPQMGYRPQLYHGDAFYQHQTMHHVATYPQNMQHAQYGGQYRGVQGRYPVQQQVSQDSPHQLALQQPYMNSPPERRPLWAANMAATPPVNSDQLTPLQEDFNGLSLHSDKAWQREIGKYTGGAFIIGDEETLPNKATVSISETSPAELKPDPTPSPEHEKEMEELRKRNQELEDMMKEQKDTGSYKMDNSPVGLCILINNVEFEKNRMYDEYERRKKLNEDPKSQIRHTLPKLDLKDRIGSNVDACKLEKLLQAFDFDVQRHDDLDVRAMKRVVTEAGAIDHSKYDCFMLIILSHGDAGCVFGVEGFSLKVAEIQKYFQSENCNTLINKPKIFIIQACQGSKAMPSYAPEADITQDGPQTEYEIDHSTPSKADFLIAFSTVPGYTSYRSKVEGSYFVMEIVNIFKRFYEREDLLSMMIMVNDEVGKYSRKQVPMPIPTLRKKVFFHLKEGCSLDEIEEQTVGDYQQYVASESLGAVGGNVFGAPRSNISACTQESGEQEP